MVATFTAGAATTVWVSGVGVLATIIYLSGSTVASSLQDGWGLYLWGLDLSSGFVGDFALTLETPVVLTFFGMRWPPWHTIPSCHDLVFPCFTSVMPWSASSTCKVSSNYLISFLLKITPLTILRLILAEDFNSTLATFYIPQSYSDCWTFPSWPSSILFLHVQNGVDSRRHKLLSRTLPFGLWGIRAW